MYVRWKKRLLPAVPYVNHYTKEEPPQPRSEQERLVLDAVLVESRRVDGKPRQRVIAHLASIPSASLWDPTRRCYFWEQVRDRLRDLDLPADSHASIEAKLAETVAFMDEEVAAAWKRWDRRVLVRGGSA